MGPDDLTVSSRDFSAKTPPGLDGWSDYSSYREYFILWTKLTSIADENQGPALVGHLSGEAKASAKYVPISDVCAASGMKQLIQHLDQSHPINSANQLGTDLTNLLDYTW